MVTSFRNGFEESPSVTRSQKIKKRRNILDVFVWVVLGLLW